MVLFTFLYNQTLIISSQLCIYFNFKLSFNTKHSRKHNLPPFWLPCVKFENILNNLLILLAQLLIDVRGTLELTPEYFDRPMALPANENNHTQARNWI